jgi:hypothetical protein
MNKNLVNPVILSKKVILSGAKVEYTGCPITMLILKNKPNFPRFSLKSGDLHKKQTQNKPNFYPPKRSRRRANPIYLGGAQRIRIGPSATPPGFSLDFCVNSIKMTMETGIAIISRKFKEMAR